MRINRAAFLEALNRVTPGIAKRDLIEQGKCFVFSDGSTMTGGRYA